MTAFRRCRPRDPTLRSFWDEIAEVTETKDNNGQHSIGKIGPKLTVFGMKFILESGNDEMPCPEREGNEPEFESGGKEAKGEQKDSDRMNCNLCFDFSLRPFVVTGELRHGRMLVGPLTAMKLTRVIRKWFRAPGPILFGAPPCVEKELTQLFELMVTMLKAVGNSMSDRTI